MQGHIQVEGLRELSRALRQVGDTSRVTLKTAALEAANVVADEARGRVPIRSGRLLSSIRPAGRVGGAFILAGNAKTPYAKPIHFGWKKRNIRPQPFLFDALGAKSSDAGRIFETRIAQLIAAFNN